MHFLQLNIRVTALLAILSAAAPAGATGYWNVPSTFCQCMNVGWGAGYHAPLVLGPISWHNWCAHNEVRLPYSPAPPCGCYGSSGCGCQFNSPSCLDSAVVPQPVAAPVPVSALFAPPIER